MALVTLEGDISRKAISAFQERKQKVPSKQIAPETQADEHRLNLKGVIKLDRVIE